MCSVNPLQRSAHGRIVLESKIHSFFQRKHLRGLRQRHGPENQEQNKSESNPFQIRAIFVNNSSVPHVKPSVLTHHQGDRVIEPVNQLHSPAQQFLIEDSLPCPTLQDLVDSITLFAAELLIRQVLVVTNL